MAAHSASTVLAADAPAPARVTISVMPQLSVRTAGRPQASPSMTECGADFPKPGAYAQTTACAAAKIALAEQPHRRREPALPPVMGRCDADRSEAGAPRRMGAVAPRDASPLARPLGGRPRTRLDRVRGSRQLRACPRPSGARLGCGCLQHGRAEKHFHIGRHAERIWQLRATQGRVVAELGIGDDRGHRQAARPHLLQQRQRQAPLLLKANGGGNPRPPALISREPGSGRYKRAPRRSRGLAFRHCRRSHAQRS